jgi:type VI secretion system protein ImpF
MLFPDFQEGLMPSVLDRLIDPQSAGTAARHGYSLEQIEAAVRRDVEELLNTHQSYSDLPPDLAESEHSLLEYGLPDLVSLNAVTPKQRQHIGRLVARVITEFEPRLRDVKVILVDGTMENDPQLHFHIQARLNIEPYPELAFDTILKSTTGECACQPG